MSIFKDIHSLFRHICFQFTFYFISLINARPYDESLQFTQRYVCFHSTKLIIYPFHSALTLFSWTAIGTKLYFILSPENGASSALMKT